MIDAKLMALVTAVSFGMAPVTVKLAYRHGGNTGVGMIIGLVVAVPINFALLPFMDPHWELLNPQAVAGFVLGGLAGNAIGRRWVYESFNLLGPARASTLRSTSPLITTILALLIYQEDVTPLRWAAVLAIVLGGILVSWTSDTSARGWLSQGVIFALLAAVSYGVRPILVKWGLEGANLPLAGACIGAVVALMYSFIQDRGELRDFQVDRAFAYFVLGGVLQAIALLALTFGLSAGDVSLVYPLTASAPLFTLVFTAVFLRGVDRVTPQVILGALAVVVGVIVLQ